MNVYFKAFLWAFAYYIGTNSFVILLLLVFEEIVAAEYIFLVSTISHIVLLIFALYLYRYFKKRSKLPNPNVKRFNITSLFSVLGILLLFRIFEDPILNIDLLFNPSAIPISDKFYLPKLKYAINYILKIVILIPVIEELVFRGIILEKLLQKGKKYFLALLYSSFLFSLIHINPLNLSGGWIELFTTFLFAMVAGLLYITTRNIIISVIFHILNNLLAFLIFQLNLDSYYSLLNTIHFNFFYWILVLTATVSLVLILFLRWKKKPVSSNYSARRSR